MTRMLPLSDLLNPDASPEASFAAPIQSSLSSRASPDGPVGEFATSGPSSPSVGSPGPNNNNRHRVPLDQIKFPAFRTEDQEILALMRPFGIRSTKNIGVFGEHVPYASDKQNLGDKTGRNSLEVFAYKFYYNHEAPFSPTAEPRKWIILWDYTSGLVRLMPMFKSLGYQKTKPGLAITRNPGLKEITPAITGGTVRAQGYWLPYHCAKAMFATFCHAIAPALIPLFGPLFPSECIRPSSPGFESMRIDPAIIVQSTIQLQTFRDTFLPQPGGPHPTQQAQQHGSPHSAAPSSVNDSSPANRQERTPRLVSAWSAINTPTSSGGPSTPSSPSATPASYRRPLVDQRPGVMAALDVGRLAAAQSRSPNAHHSVELPPIIAHRSVSDSYSMKRRRTHGEEPNSYRVHSLGRSELANMSDGQDRDEFHAASALLGMAGNRRLG